MKIHFKKLVCVIMAAFLLAVPLCGCNNGAVSSGEAQPPRSSAAPVSQQPPVSSLAPSPSSSQEPSKPDDTAPDGELTADDIAQRIMDAVEFPEMVKLNDKRLTLFYGLDVADVEQYSVFVCSDSIQCDELAVIKARPDMADVVLMGVKSRWEEQKESFLDYLPEQYAVLEKAVIKVKGDYVFMAVSPEAGAASGIFDACFE